MAKITRIKASDDSSKRVESSEPTITRKKVVVKDKKLEKANRKQAKKAERLAKKQANTEHKPFILIRPFVYLGRYLRDSWRELRQVRWPNRKATWKMVLAVIIYTVLFVIIITLLDMFFSWLFSILLSK